MEEEDEREYVNGKRYKLSHAPAPAPFLKDTNFLSGSKFESELAKYPLPPSSHSTASPAYILYASHLQFCSALESRILTILSASGNPPQAAHEVRDMLKAYFAFHGADAMYVCWLATYTSVRP